jgi:hypothetical protein
MNITRSGWRVLLALGLLVTLGACSEPRQDVASAPAPPPPPPDARAKQTFDYPRSAHKTDKKLRRKLVVAMVRFASDKPIDDVPFGRERIPEGGDAPTVQVNIIDQIVFVPGEEKPPGLDVRSRQMLKRELLETDAFVVVERDSILDILREIQFGQTKYVNPDTSPEVGEIMSVQYLLEGSIGRNEDRSFKDSVTPPPNYDEHGPSLAERIFSPDRVRARERLDELQRMRFQRARVQEMQAEYPYGAYISLYNVCTSEIAAEAFGIGATRLDALRDAVDDLVDRCIDLAEPPRIAYVENDRVFLDLGQSDGVEIGQRFRYLSQGKVVRNAAGQVIGRDEQEAGVVEITRVEPLMSVAKMITRAAEPKRGDRVERVEVK